MVTVNVFFEGGALPSSNPNADTMDNTNALREAFNTLLNAGLDKNVVRIAAFPQGPISNVVKIRTPNSLLLIDLDAPKTEKTKRIQDQKMYDIKEEVFFMVQRMEAWILSQPDIIESVFQKEKVSKADVKEDDKLKNKHPENIAKPDDVLNTIFQRYFERENGKKLKYGKLKHSPQLIERLDIQKLKNTFEDVEALLTKVNNMAV